MHKILYGFAVPKMRPEVVEAEEEPVEEKVEELTGVGNFASHVGYIAS